MSNNQPNEQNSIVPPEAENKLCWYVVHTYSGYENKVMDTLRKSVDTAKRCLSSSRRSPFLRKK